MKINEVNLDGKITLAHVKRFIARNADALHIRVGSRFDGMTDCCQPTGEKTFTKAEFGDTDLAYTLGVRGVYLVGGSRNSFTKFSAEGFIGIRWYNCCGSGVIAIPAPTPVEPSRGTCAVCHNHASVPHYCEAVLRNVGAIEACTGVASPAVQQAIADNVSAGRPANYGL